MNSESLQKYFEKYLLISECFHFDEIDLLLPYVLKMVLFQGKIKC